MLGGGSGGDGVGDKLQVIESALCSIHVIQKKRTVA